MSDELEPFVDGGLTIFDRDWAEAHWHDGRPLRQPRITLERVGWLCDKGHLHEQEDCYVAEGKGQAVYRLVGQSGSTVEQSS